MSNNAMSNETDLDWLARVLHKWPDGGGITMLGRGCSFFDTGVGRSVHVYAVDGSDYTTIKEKDWLARRAELQNKPGWEGAPEWSEWLAQDEDGEWKWLAGLPVKYVDGWAAVEIKFCCKGVVLGDWRDTLEKRPADLSEQAVTARLKEATDNVLSAAPELMKDKYKFEPFVSIEDSQEKEMKQDNKWFERGELPPVGTECEIGLGAKWRKAFVVGRNYTGRIVVEIDTCNFIVAYGCTFRPIRTERDVLIEIIKKTDDTDDKMADAILAAGFSLRDK